MSPTPRQAAFLAELFDPDPAVRTAAVLAHVGDRVEAASVGVGPHVRARLDHPDPAVRLTAADYLWRVSGDPEPAVEVLCDLCERSEVDAVREALPLFALLGKHAAEPLAAFARNLSDVFAEQPDDFVMWAASTVLTSGEDAPDRLRRMLACCPPATASLVLMECATLAPRLDHPPDEEVVRAQLEDSRSVPAAGAALWRLTWRVNQSWLDRIARPTPAGPDLLALLTRVLVEHLGRRPDVAPIARAYLVRLADKWESAALAEVGRLARLGGRGWGVLLLVLQDSPPDDRVAVPSALRAAVFREALPVPAVHALVRHHAHRVVFERGGDQPDRRGGDDQLLAAAAILGAIGPPAGSAFPDLLRVIGREPHIGGPLAAAAKAVAPGHPLPLSATIRALASVPPTGGRVAFSHLAGVLFHLDPDSGPGLVSQTAVPDSVVTEVLDSGHWRNLPPDTRRRHAAAIADLLASPRKDVRARAADALRRYLPELPGVWPAVVAALAAADEDPVRRLLGYVRLLAPVADAVAVELHALFDEPNVDYAARAAVALWRLGRWAEVAPRVRAAEPLARAMLSRVWRHDHGLHEDLAILFDGEPLGAEARTRLEERPSVFDTILTGLIRTEPLSDAKWKAIRDAADACMKPRPPLLALAVMSGFGTGEFQGSKIWMIKHHREMTRIGLAESKRAIERVMDLLAGDPTPQARAQAVREFFPAAGELPHEITTLLCSGDLSLRWAGLELADAWGLRPHEVVYWVEERRRDANPFVRDRAARIVGTIPHPEGPAECA